MFSFGRIGRELRGISATLLLVAALTAIAYPLMHETGLTHGSTIFLIPVMIAAIRWGIAAALVGAVAGVAASAYFFFPPRYTIEIRDLQDIAHLSLFIVVAVVMSQLASRLKKQAELARQREIDMRDLYEFSRRLAAAYDVSDIHAAIEDHLASVVQRRVVLFASAKDTSSSGQRGGGTVPERVLAEVTEVASGRQDTKTGTQVITESGEVWLVHAVSPHSREFGVIAVNLGRVSQQAADEFRIRVNAVLADATATLERLGVAHAITEARMRAQTNQLREALIGSVSHELRTPLASIMGAATVLSSAPALDGEKKLKALADGVRDEAVRLNNDIQNLLDASRISSDGINPNKEWADPADIVNSTLQRCGRRIGSHRVALDIPADLPLVHVDPVLVQQALVQLIDNAVKYSKSGSQIAVKARADDRQISLTVSDEGAGLTSEETTRIWERFVRGERHVATTSGSGLGLWIANAFVAANGGKMHATSAGAGLGSTISIELPVAHATVAQMERNTDE